MKLFQIENNYNYSAKCSNCPSSLKFNIDKNKLIINAECKNRHIFEDINPSQLVDLIKNTYYFKNYCYKCQSIINEDNRNFICLDCDKLFCNNCINKLNKEKGHKNIIFNNNYRFCKLHYINNTFFCENCKRYLCQECKNLHESHKIQFFFDNIPNKKNKNVINSRIDEYIKKIEKLIEFIIKKKEEIDKRFNKLKDFLNSLLFINEKLLKKFNYSIFDYYNFYNFNLFYDYQNNELSLDQSNNLNYLFYGPILNDSNNINQNKSLIITKNNNIEKLTEETIDNFNICDYKNLKYLKDNIFILYEQKNGKTTLKFFEYKNFSFKLYFEKILGNYDKIDFIKIGRYNNLFIITKGKKNKIYLVKYNINEKTACIDKIYDPYHKTNFNDIIDIKNDYYVISDSKGIKIFYNFFKPENIIKNIKGNYTLLNNVNNLIFISEDLNSNFHFFNSEKYELIKYIHFPAGFKFVNIFENNILIFTQKFCIFYFVNIKYLEIVQKLDYLKTNRCIAINNNGIYEFLFEIKKIEIKKYNFNEGRFYDLTKIESLDKNINQKNIKYLNDKYLFLAIEDELEIFYF